MKLTETLESVYGLTPEDRLYHAEVRFAQILSHLENTTHPVMDIEAIEDQIRAIESEQAKSQPSAQFFIPPTDRVTMQDRYREWGVPDKVVAEVYRYQAGGLGINQLKQFYQLTGSPIFSEAYTYRRLEQLLRRLRSLQDFYYKKQEILAAQGEYNSEIYASLRYSIKPDSRRLLVHSVLDQRAFFKFYKPIPGKQVVRVDFSDLEMYTLCNLIDPVRLEKYFRNPDYSPTECLAAMVYGISPEDVTSDHRHTLSGYIVAVVTSRAEWHSKNGLIDTHTWYDGVRFDGVFVSVEAQYFLDAVSRFADDRVFRVGTTPEGRLLLKQPSDRVGKVHPTQTAFHLIECIDADFHKLLVTILSEKGFMPYHMRSRDLYYLVDEEDAGQLASFEQALQAAAKEAAPAGFFTPALKIEVSGRLPAVDFSGTMLNKPGAAGYVGPGKKGYGEQEEDE